MKIFKFIKPRFATMTIGHGKFTTKSKNPATHVIFDLDGTILDTENVHREIFTKKMKELGLEYDDEVHKAVAGLKTIERCKYIVEKFGLSLTAEELDHKVQENKLEFFSNTKLKPGAERLITHLYCSKVPFAVATGTSKENYDIKTKAHRKLFGLFHHVVNAGSDPEVPVSKPDPLVYLVCASRFEKKPHPEECLVFEDSYYGLLAGRKAGMQVVLVPELEYTEDQIKGAVLVIQSLEDFKPEEFSLAPYPLGE